MANRIQGVVIGIVEDLNDPEGLGRVRVRLPWLGGEPLSHWARVATPFASAETGFHFRPQVGDEALLAFEHGNTDYPYVLGYLWSGENTPPALDSDAQRLVTTIAGHRLVFDDGDQPSLTIEDGNGNKLVMNAEGIQIESAKDVLIKGANINIEADQQLTLKGNPVHINP